MKKLYIFLFFFFFSFQIFSQNVKIYGTISDEYNNIIDEAIISTNDGVFTTKTNDKGKYEFFVNKKYRVINFRRVGYELRTVDIPSNESEVEINVVLISVNEIDSVVVTGIKLNSQGNIAIDPKIANRIPSLTESIENLVKMQIGVVSRNEMSSQYSVRGGNFDENLVYVNGIEIYRPQLIRSGQQEGLSFINPALVSSVNFSAGGFGTKYGDKMSSVLDIKYKRPKEFEAGISGSLLGASAYVCGASKDKMFTHVTGIRYKTTKYILNSLDTKGDYKPSFIDFQSFLTYSFNSEFDISFLANISNNKFDFVPKSKETNFGTISNAYGLYIYFEGQEINKFSSFAGAFTGNYHPFSDINYSLSISAFSAEEAETYDILGAYSLNELNRDIGSSSAGDSLLNLGIGKFIRHARNYLYINAFSINHKGFYDNENHYINWGIEYKYEDITDKINEWELIDSAGYSIPYNGSEINLYKNISGENDLHTDRFSAYIQDRYSFDSDDAEYEIVAGVRLNYNTYNEEILLSPRISAAYKPNERDDLMFRIAGGLYYQPPFYREIRMFDGTLIYGSKAQRAIHILAGNEFDFDALGRHLKMTTEIYYKKLDNLIPFEVDNVKVKYYANQRAKGYAAGIDAKISGDFVPGTHSWFSISLMKTEEDVFDTGNGKDDGYGYIPRPTDQLVSASLVLQDYVPGNKNFKVNLNLVYGTSFKFGPPETERANAILTSPDYKRVDLGASVVLLKKDRKERKFFLHIFKSLWLTVEVFNLLDVQNTVSYMWLRIVPNTAVPFDGVFQQTVVPNYLTGRRLNLKLSIKF